MESTRVLVKKAEQTIEASFIDCLLDILEVPEDQHQIPVEINFQNNCITIYDLNLDTDNPQQESYTAVLKHSTRCPFRELKQNNILHTLPETKDVRNFKIAAAIIVESSDKFILLTKRPSHMRTYPGSWVPPGGHVEPQESLRSAVARELSEEIGLEIDHLSDSIKVLGLWEAVFPPIIEWGYPNRHHLIIYFHFVSNETKEQLQHKIKLDHNEVAASVWLNTFYVSTLINTTDSTTLRNLIPTCEATIINDKGDQSIRELPINELFNCENFEGRITVGTKFALEEWLKAMEKSVSQSKLIPCGTNKL